MLRNRYFVAAIIILLIGVFIFNLNFFLRRKHLYYLKTPERSTFASRPVIKTVEPEYSRNDAVFEQVKSDPARWRRDPFFHRVEEVKKIGSSGINKKDSNVNITLEGIMKTDGRLYALINGWAFKKGDKIEEFIIEEVFEDGIILKGEGGRKTIKIE